VDLLRLKTLPAVPPPLFFEHAIRFSSSSAKQAYSSKVFQTPWLPLILSCRGHTPPSWFPFGLQALSFGFKAAPPPSDYHHLFHLLLAILFPDFFLFDRSSIGASYFFFSLKVLLFESLTPLEKVRRKSYRPIPKTDATSRGILAPIVGVLSDVGRINYP